MFVYPGPPASEAGAQLILTQICADRRRQAQILADRHRQTHTCADRHRQAQADAYIGADRPIYSHSE